MHNATLNFIYIFHDRQLQAEGLGLAALAIENIMLS